MPRSWILSISLLAAGLAALDTPAGAAPIGGRPAESQTADAWFDALSGSDKAGPSHGDTLLVRPPAACFSFRCGGHSSADLLCRSARTCVKQPRGTDRIERTTTWRDPKTDLEVTLEAVLFRDFPAVEWVVRIANRGVKDSPLVTDLLPLAAKMAPVAAAGRSPILHYAKGAFASIDDFAPVDRPLSPGADVRLETGGGRSSSEVLPFFNIDFGGAGTILGIGWTGQWAATFGCDGQKCVSVGAGMATTHLKLHPGETIRTPRMLAMFWQGERMRGNNLLRRFLLAHHRPAPGGKPLVLPVLIGAWGGSPAADHLRDIKRIIRHEVPIGLYWIDAEWFGQAPWFKSNGNWAVRKDLYPQGFRALSDPLHAAGRQFLLWFEPQRVCAGTPWAQFKDRPNWLLDLKGGEPSYKQHDGSWPIPHEDPRWVIRESRRSQMIDGDRLWNMGEPASRQFLTDWLSDRIKEFGLDWYREDFNIAPLEYWQHADPPDRRGIAEIRYVEGLYQMWDELLRRHPHLAIDNCASGGRRIDLESIGRATALWRTDWPVDAIHKQCHTFGLMSWVPLHMSSGSMLVKGNEYELRSTMTAGLNCLLPPADDEQTMKQAKALVQDYLAIQKFYYGDYYPLTPYSQSPDAWLAYQLHLPQSNEGLVVVLKRPKSAQKTQRLRLFGLDSQAMYEVTNLDNAHVERLGGKALVDAGIEVQLARQPDSAIYRYIAGPQR